MAKVTRRVVVREIREVEVTEQVEEQPDNHAIAKEEPHVGGVRRFIKYIIGYIIGLFA